MTWERGQRLPAELDGDFSVFERATTVDSEVRLQSGLDEFLLVHC